MGDDFDASFERIAPALIDITNKAQSRTATAAAEYVPQVLAATDQVRADAPRWGIEPRQWVGTAGDGMPTETLLYGAVARSKQAVGRGADTRAALASGGEFLSTALGTLLSDTSRGAIGAATSSRPIGGYVRMLTPPSCGRCVILGGKWYRHNAGFDRHPDCDCVHIPTAENKSGDMTTDPTAYLNSLSEDDLAKALGSKANARTWLEFGQDNPRATMNQLVNAYRGGGGIRTAQLYDKTVKYTLEGTTRRGVAYHQMANVRALTRQGEVKDGRYRRIVAPRLMPESIMSLAKDKAHAKKLLQDHGWLGIV